MMRDEAGYDGLCVSDNGLLLTKQGGTEVRCKCGKKLHVKPQAWQEH